ncbi:MAG: hypothetical protein RJB38_1702 [Pseudomonadota bacterium]|jgi:Tfp pilus assembly protein PilN
MIKINLASRKMASGASLEGSSGTALSAVLSRFIPQASGGGPSLTVSDLPLRAILVGLVGAFGAQFYFDGEREAVISRLDTQIEKAKSVQTGLQNQLKEAPVMEELKTRLEADERLVRTKLETIMKLMQDRQTSVHALKVVSTSIPSEVWLSQLSFSPSEVSFVGQALDYNQISDFMNRLGQADFMTDLNLDGSSQVKDEKGVTVNSFRITAKRK